MPDLAFLLAVFALVAVALATRLAVSWGHFAGLPPMPREH
jgi:hypothetical protein